MAINKTDSVSKAKPGSAKKFGKTEKSLQAELSLPTDVPAGTELVAEAPSTHEIPADIQSWLAEAQSAWKKQQAEDERLTLEQESGARVVYLADASMAGNTMTDAGNMLLAQNTSASATEVESESKAALLPDEIAFNPAWLGLGLLGLAGGGGGGGGGGVVVDAVHNLVSGAVVLGPVITGHGLTVNVYAANGTTLLGTGVVSAAGTFSVDVGSYTGVVIAKLADASTGVDFTDEATGVAHDLTANLMTVGVANTGTITLNINALTTVAAQEAGAVFTGASTVTITAEIANNANTAVANTFGLTDLTGSAIVTTVDSAGNPNAAYNTADGLSNAEQYGSILAALSGVDSANGGNMQTTIDDIVTGLTITGTTGTLAPAALDVIIEGARAVSDTTAGSGDTLLTAVVSDMTQKVSPSVSIDDISVDNIILEGELATLTGTNVSGATVDLTIGGNLVAAIVTGTTWSYTLNSADLTAIGIGGETIQATATLSGATANTTRSIFVNAIPVANADTLAAAFGTPTIFAAADLLGNDTDANNDTLTIDSVTSGTGGTVVLNGDGTVTFTPNNGFNGAAADFTYTVSDGTAISSTATVTVNVAADSNIFFNPSSAPFALSISTDASVPSISAIASVSADVSLDVSPDQAAFLALGSAAVLVQTSADDSSASLTLNNASGDIATLGVESSGGSADASATINSNGSLTISAVNVEVSGDATGGNGGSSASVSISGNVTLGDFITVTASGQSADASFSTNSADSVVFTNVTNGITVTTSSEDATASMNVYNATGTVSTIAVQATVGNRSTASADLYGSFTILDSIAVTTSGSADTKNAHLQLGNNNASTDIGPVIDIATVNVTASGSGDMAELYAYNASGTVSSITVLADNNDATALAYFSQNASAAASFTLGSTVDVTASALWSNAWLNYDQNDGASPGVIFANTTLNVTASGNSSDASFYANKASGTIVDINLTASGSAGSSGDMASANIYGGFTINGTVTVLADRSGTQSSADAYLRLDSFNNGVDGGIVFANAAIDVTASAQDSYASVDIFSASGTVSSINVTTSGFSSSADVAIYGDGTHNITITDSVSVTATDSNDSSSLTLGNQGDIGVVFSSADLNVEASIGDRAAASLSINEASGTLTSVIVTASVESSDARLDLYRSSVDTSVLTIGSTLTVSATSHDAYAGVQLDTDSGNQYQALARLTDGTGAIADGTYTLTVGATTLTHTITGGNGSIGDLHSAFNNTMNALYPDADFEVGYFQNSQDSSLSVTGTDFAAHVFTIQRTGDSVISSAVSQDVVAPTTIAFNNTAISVLATGDSSDVELDISGATGTITDITIQSSGAAGGDGDSADALIAGNFTINGNITVQAQGADNNGSESADAVLSLSGDVTFDTVIFQTTASGLSAEAKVDIENAHGTLSSINVTSSARFASADVNFSHDAGTGTLNVGTITVTASNHEAEAHLRLEGYEGRYQQATLTVAIDGNGNVAAGVYNLAVNGMTVSYEVLASSVTGTNNNYQELTNGLRDALDRVYGGTHLSATLMNPLQPTAGSAMLVVQWNDYADHATNLASLTLPSTTVVASELSQVAIAQTDIHLNNSVINIDGTGFSAEAGLTIANATGTITSINLDHNGGGGEGSTASAEINGDFAIGNITVHSSRGSSDLELGNGGDDNVITMTGNQILVTAGILPADVNGSGDTASAYLNAENVHGSISNISVRTTATSMSGEAIAVLNGNFTLAQSTLDIVATGKDAIAGMTLYGSGGNTDLTNYDVTLTSMAIGLEATDFESRASLDLADALGTITSISVVASGLSADASADIDFSGSLSGNISVTASGSETVADLYMTAGTPTDLTLAWYDSSRGGAGFAFVAGQTYTLTVGATTLSYTMQAGDVVAGDNLTRTVNLINGLKNDPDYAGADFQLLHPYNDNGGMNSFHVMWNDASAVNRDEFSLTCDDGGTLSNMRDYGLWTRYETDHDGSDITLTSATDITATASGAHSSADIELDNLVGNIDTITAIASGGNMVSTANYYHDAIDNGYSHSGSSDFAGASAEVVVRVDGSVSNIVINATNIEDRALVAVSQTVQGGTATVSGDGRTALHLGDATVDMVNLTALHTGTWGAFDLRLVMADADLGAADSAALTASLMTINDFNGDRDSINLFSPYDTTTIAWAWNFNNTAMHYSENEGDALLFSTFLTDAEAALDGNTAANPDYYFGVVGSDGYLAYDMGGTGITGVLKLAGVTSFDEANVGDHDRWKLLGNTSGNVTDIILNDATRIEYASNVGVYNASTLGIQYTSTGLIDSLSAHANADIGADDSVSLTLTENGTGDIIFRQALIAVSADTASPGGTACGADATLTVSDARGTIERITLNADAGHDAYAVSYDSSATANFYAFSGAVNEIELVALGNADRDAFVELNMIGATALTESVQNLCMTVESADATANLKLSGGFVVKTEVAIDTASDVSVVTLGIEQTVHGGEVFAASSVGDDISAGVYQNGSLATFDLTYTGATADKVSLGQMVWDNVTNADVFTAGNFEGDFKLWLYVPDTDNADFTVSGALQTNMLTIEGFDTGATTYDDTNAWLDDRISFNNSQNGEYLKSLTDAVTVETFLSAADTALDGTVDYYFGVVGSNGYLAMDVDGTGITQVIEFLGMTDLDYTRINGAAPVV